MTDDKYEAKIKPIFYTFVTKDSDRRREKERQMYSKQADTQT